MIFKKEKVITGERAPITVTYFVTDATEAEDIPVPLYGVGVSTENERAFSPSFSPQKEAAVALCEMLYKGNVTPTSFFEILDDYLCEKI